MLPFEHNLLTIKGYAVISEQLVRKLYSADLGNFEAGPVERENMWMCQLRPDAILATITDVSTINVPYFNLTPY